VDGQGNIFVADYNNQRVQKFDVQGAFITAWTLASDLNATGTPEGIAVDAQGRVYITDYQFGRVEVFSNDGEQLLVFGSHGLEDGQFRRPTGIAIDAQGNAYVVSQTNNNLQVFKMPEIGE
jgi:DNA-binding beta-propeller fold protein YncE